MRVLCAVSAAVVLAAGGAVPAAAATPKVSALDRTFVVEAGQGGAFEIAAGKLAAARGAAVEIKTFGARMVVDHTKAGAELRSLATGLGLDVPAGPDTPQRAVLAVLGTLDGPVLDCAYAAAEYFDHVAAVGLFDKEAQHGRNGRLRDFARTTLPTLREHRAMLATTLQHLRCSTAGPAPGEPAAGS